MRRLRDEDGDDPVAARGIEFLRGTPPAARSPESKRRVWSSIQRANATTSAGISLARLRGATGVIAVIAVLGSAGTVIAARRWIGPIFRRAAPASSVPIPDPKEKAPIGGTGSHRRARTSVSLPVGGAPEPPAQQGPLPAPSIQPPPVRKVAPARRLSPSLASPSKRDTPAVVERLPLATAATVRERAEVHDAMVALRRDRDPVTAGRMLDTYLTAHPTGTLREEALVLAIEAGDARGDLPVVRRLARQYQATYPTGRFREFAQAAMGR
jgi:hypothetical protein